MAASRRAKLAFWLALVAASLFVPAGTLAWPGAWLFLALFIGGMFATMAWLKRHDPALYAERTRPFRQPGQPFWDTAIGLVIGIVWYGWLVAMALETRATGGPRTPVAVLAGGAAAMLAGYWLCVASFKANTFAAITVRLQAERGQSVIDTGPYAIVRHPIYAASLLMHAGTAALLGVRWSLAGLPVLVVILAVRAVLEEKTVLRRLDGYDAYAARVRYRLVPGVW